MLEKEVLCTLLLKVLPKGTTMEQLNPFYQIIDFTLWSKEATIQNQMRQDRLIASELSSSESESSARNNDLVSFGNQNPIIQKEPSQVIEKQPSLIIEDADFQSASSESSQDDIEAGKNLVEVKTKNSIFGIQKVETAVVSAVQVVTFGDSQQVPK